MGSRHDQQDTPPVDLQPSAAPSTRQRRQTTALTYRGPAGTALRILYRQIILTHRIECRGGRPPPPDQSSPIRRTFLLRSAPAFACSAAGNDERGDALDQAVPAGPAYRAGRASSERLHRGAAGRSARGCRNCRYRDTTDGHEDPWTTASTGRPLKGATVPATAHRLTFAFFSAAALPALKEDRRRRTPAQCQNFDASGYFAGRSRPDLKSRPSPISGNLTRPAYSARSAVRRPQSASSCPCNARLRPALRITHRSGHVGWRALNELRA